MMRAISNGQVEGFPTQDEVRSIFIENDIQGSQLEMNVAEYICDSIGFGIKITLEEAKEALLEGGFTDVCWTYYSIVWRLEDETCTYPCYS